MSAQRSDAACTATCHLPGGTTVTHSAHPERGAACTTCHPVAASPAEGTGSAHHVAPPKPPPSETPTPAPAVTRFTPDDRRRRLPGHRDRHAFGGVTGVAFNGSQATFVPISASCVLAWVPAGATSGAIAVTTPAGTGGSSTVFTVIAAPAGPVTAELSLALASTAVKLGARVRASGRLDPASLAGGAVALKVQRRVDGRWVLARSASVASGATGDWTWSYRPSRRGAYRLRAAVAATAAHTADATAWARFTVR